MGSLWEINWENHRLLAEGRLTVGEELGEELGLLELTDRRRAWTYRNLQTESLRVELASHPLLQGTCHS
jgi:hypothetical protein